MNDYYKVNASAVTIQGVPDSTFPITVRHRGNKYALSLEGEGDAEVIVLRLTPITTTLDGRVGVPVEIVRASGVTPRSLIWGNIAFDSAWNSGEFHAGASDADLEAGNLLRRVLDRVEYTNRLLLASGAKACKRVFMQANDALFIGVYPTGLVFSHRGLEKDGDYLRVGFMPYDTLELAEERWFSELDPEIAALVREEVNDMKAKKGQLYPISSCNQTVLLGEAMTKQKVSAEMELPKVTSQGNAKSFAL